MPFCAALCEEMCDGTEQQRHRARALRHLAEWYGVVAQCGVVPSPGEAAQLRLHVFGFLQHWVWLSRWALDHGLLRYQVLPKHHYLAHMGLRCRAGYLSPKVLWTYLDEGLIGRITGIFGSTMQHGSVSAQPTVLAKYLMLVSILFCRGE